MAMNDGIPYIETNRQMTPTGEEKLRVQFDFQVARLAARATEEILGEMVRKEAMTILTGDPALQQRIHELALSYLTKLAAKHEP
jgi:predicted trehalose synthase